MSNTNKKDIMFKNEYEYMSHHIDVYDDENKRKEYLRKLAITNSGLCIPYQHVKYLVELKEKYNIDKPQVIYDIGACVLHWTNTIKTYVWNDPSTEFILFDAFADAEFLYKEGNYRYNIDVLSDEVNKEVKWFENPIFPGGNSYFKENNDIIFPEHEYIMKKTNTLSNIVKTKGFPLPDIVKIDVQGCEKDVILGGKEIIQYAKHLIVELQHTNYNIGAPLCNEVISLIESFGFKLETPLFCNNGNDGDYHFVKI